MWSVLGDSGDTTREAEGSHAYLILTQEDGSMVLQTGEYIIVMLYRVYKHLNPHTLHHISPLLSTAEHRPPQLISRVTGPMPPASNDSPQS